MRTIYFIRDYDRTKSEYAEIMENYPKVMSDICGGHSGSISDPTCVAFLKAEKLGSDIRAIENALKEIPEEYRTYVLKNVTMGYRFPDVASRGTWSRQKQKFIYKVAKNMGWM